MSLPVSFQNYKFLIDWKGIWCHDFLWCCVSAFWEERHKCVQTASINTHLQSVYNEPNTDKHQISKVTGLIQGYYVRYIGLRRRRSSRDNIPPQSCIARRTSPSACNMYSLWNERKEIWRRSMYIMQHCFKHLLTVQLIAFNKGHVQQISLRDVKYYVA